MIMDGITSEHHEENKEHGSEMAAMSTAVFFLMENPESFPLLRLGRCVCVCVFSTARGFTHRHSFLC